MLSVRRSWGYLLVIVSVIVALLISILVRPIFALNYFVVYLIAVTINVWYGGLISGLLTTLLSALGYIYFLGPSPLTFTLDGPNFVRVGLFIFLGTLISFLYETRRHGQESAFTQSQKYEATLASIGDGVITTDDQGHVITINRVAQTLTGWSQSEAQGKNIQEVFVIANEETQQTVDSPVTTVLREGRIVGLANHTVLIDKTGAQTPIDDSGAPIRDSAGNVIGTVLVFRAITERREAERALRDAEILFRTIANTAPALIWLSDVNGLATFFNQRWLDFTGHTLEQEVGNGWYAGIHREDVHHRLGTYRTALVARQHFEIEYRLRRFDGEYRWVIEHGVPRFSSDSNFVGYTGSCIDITERKHEEETQRFLTEAAALLTSSLEVETTLQNVGRLAVPKLADWFAVDLISEDLVLQQTIVTHIDPAKIVLAREVRKRFPPDPKSGELTDVLQRGKPQFIREISDEMLVAVATNDEERQMLRTLGLKSIIIVPIIGYNRILGMITLVAAESDRRYAEADLVFAQELARWVALALQNAQLYREAQQATQKAQSVAERLSRSQAVTEAFSRVLMVSEVLDVIINQGLSVLGADAGVIALLNDHRDSLQIVSATGYTAETLQSWRHFLVSEATPMGEVVRTGQPIWFRADESTMDRYPVFDVPKRGARVALPLIVDGQATGAIWLNFSSTADFSQEDRDFIMLQTQKCAQAIDRARLYEAERQARTQAESSRDRLTFLVQANTLLASILDDELRLQSIAEFVIPYLADWCVIDLIEKDGEIRRVAISAKDRAKEAVLFKSQERYKKNTPTLGGEVMRVGESKLFSQITDLRTIAQDDEHLGQLQALEMASMMIVPIAVRGKLLGIITLAFAESGRRYGADELALAEELADRIGLTVDNIRLFVGEALARKEAEQANEIKLKFLATISHELRTPLTSIKGFATTLLANDVIWDAENQRDFITIISEEADKLTDLIDQLLDLSRLQAGTLRIQPVPCTMTAILNTAMAQLEALTDQHQRVITLSPDLPLVMADMQRIAAVLVNLVENAAKYAPPSTQITISASAQADCIQVNVSDEGPGIPSENREKVFEAFWQLEKPAPQQTKGVGLGLAICRGLVNAHGGTIWVADSMVGTTISFTLPLAKSAF